MNITQWIPYIRSIFDPHALIRLFMHILQCLYPKQKRIFTCCVLWEHITDAAIIFSEHSLKKPLKDSSKPPKATDFYTDHALSQCAFERIRQSDNTHPLTRNPLATCYIYDQDNNLISTIKTQQSEPREMQQSEPREMTLAQLDILLLDHINFYVPSLIILIQEAQENRRQNNRITL